MRRLRLLLNLAVLALGIIAGSADASVPPFCDSFCTPSTDCNGRCVDPVSNVWMSCADYGGPCEYQTCAPVWVVTQTVAIAAFEVDQPFPMPGHCEYWTKYRRTWHDANNCGEPDHYTCFYDHVPWDVEQRFTCCSFWFCFGNPNSCG